MKIRNFIQQFPLITAGFVLGLLYFKFTPTYVIQQWLFFFIASLLVWEILFAYLSNFLRDAQLSVIRITVMFLYATVVVGYLFQPMLGAQWGIIDDHEIVSYLGFDQRMSMFEIPARLMSTEVGQYGEALRYRPSYYVMRLLETVILGWNPSAWYAVRLLSFCIAAAIFWNLLTKKIPFALAGVTTILLLGNYFWTDLFTRLGPAETYGVITLALYALTFAKLWSTKKRHHLYWLSLAGNIVCLTVLVGIKENFMLLLLPQLLLIIRTIRSKFSPLIAVGMATPIFYGLFIANAIILAVSKAKTDIYANSVGIADRAGLLIGALNHDQLQILFGVTLVAVIVLLVQIGFRQNKSPILKDVIAVNLAGITCIVIYLSQFVFYNGAWPTGMRYDFPGALVLPVLIALGFGTIVNIMRRYAVPPAFIWSLYVGSIIGLAAQSSMGTIQTYATIRDVSSNVAANTRSFTERINQIATLINQKPESTLFLESSEPLDYELLFSTTLFLRAFGSRNPVALKLHNYDKIPVDATLRYRLAADLQRIAETGSDLFSASASANSTDCHSIVFSGEQLSSCERLSKP